MHVLIGTDGSTQSLAAARYLRSFADPANIDKVSVLAVARPLAAVPFALDIDIDQSSTADGQTWEDQSFRKAASDATEVVAAELRGWAREVSTHVWSGSPSSQIVKPAEQMSSGLIVVASRSSAVETVLMGSVAHRVLSHAPVRCSWSGPVIGQDQVVRRRSRGESRSRSRSRWRSSCGRVRGHVDRRRGGFLPRGHPRGRPARPPHHDGREPRTFLGMLPDGRIALTRKADGTLTYELTPRHELPEEAEMVTPGGVVGR